MNENRPIVIIGLEHCGTTYLVKKLSEAGVQMWGPDGYDTGMECKALTMITANEINRAIGQGRMHTRYPFTYDVAKPRGGDFGLHLDVYRGLREDQAKEAGGVRWGCKEPRISRLLPAFFERWPDALYVYMERNLWRCVHTSWRRNVAWDAWAKLQTLHAIAAQVCLRVRQWGHRNQVFVWPYDVEDEALPVLNEAFCRWSGVEVDLVSDWGDRKQVSKFLPWDKHGKRGEVPDIEGFGVDGLEKWGKKED